MNVRTPAILILGFILFSLVLLTAGCGKESDANDSTNQNQDAGHFDVHDEDADNEDVHDEDVDPSDDATWSKTNAPWPSAFLSVSGTSCSDIWVVGARVHDQATVLHFDGDRWERTEIEDEVDLWWVHTTTDGEVFLGGSDGAVLRLVDGAFERFDTLSLARHTVFGVWGSGEDLYAVGGIGSRSGFVWHFDGDQWRSLPLPKDIPLLENGVAPGLFKVWGDDHGTVWFVGAAGTVLRRDADGPLTLVEVPTKRTLFTIHGNADQVIAVGGDGSGLIVELSDDPKIIEPQGAPLFQGISVQDNGEAWAAGGFGELYHRDNEGSWERVDSGLDLFIESLHAVWSSPDGEVWAVGGNVISPELDQGLILTNREDFEMPPLPEPPEFIDETDPDHCHDDIVSRGDHGSLARRWIEQNLQAIRLEVPEPGVHARNLYHLSVALFDAWASFEEEQSGVVVDVNAGEYLEEHGATDRDEVMSYAAYTLLAHRYGDSLGARRSTACFRQVLEDLGYDPQEAAAPSRPQATLGVTIGQEIIDHFFNDGALEEFGYVDEDYHPPAPPLSVDEPGTDSEDPELWQPLDLAQAITQNGIAIDGGEQGYIGPHWGEVTPFSITRPAADQSYVEPGPRPSIGPALQQWVVEVLEKTAWLDTEDTTTMDASPGAYGNNSLGADDGDGHELNPRTGHPYEPQIVRRSDFGRVLAEYWADGPDSETPPGHWNTIAHQAMDHPDFQRRLFGTGDLLAELTYDVHLYLLLNGALHDAAIVAWELKRLYETARPITLIRWMGDQGQATDPALPNYHPDGLPLVDGLIEVITEASTAPGQRHEYLAAYIGEIAVFTWPGAPGDYRHRSSRCVWMRAVEWSPYQPSTFVSPAFPGYVSGHSTFSHSAAALLTSITGDPFFPGGLAEFYAEGHAYLDFESGPSADLRLQWATYQDAADQAGQSRIWGGIHIAPDDFDGRNYGAIVGESAVQWGRENLAAVED